MSTAKDKIQDRLIEELTSPADWAAFAVGGGLGFCASIFSMGADAGQFAVGGGFVAVGLRKATSRLFRRRGLRKKCEVLLAILSEKDPSKHLPPSERLPPSKLLRTLGSGEIRGQTNRGDMSRRVHRDMKLFDKGLVSDEWFEQALQDYIEELRKVPLTDDRNSRKFETTDEGGDIRSTAPAIALPEFDEEQGNQEKLNQ